MNDIFKLRKACREDVECQCMALAYAAHHIEHNDVRELLLFTLMEKQHQLATKDFFNDTCEVSI
ncbi:hypothetical protein SJI19_21910 [Acerihabitans sp. TG2]|uniref:hypothetical protein n=1 Tax=Acerihabitans sp. TG2 TaxID=3096008 RepID=UPI002B23404B|nr:hypothetical protein [Acerihabitans sp. TG2]MEA9393160.1 hypothetical protein [Acerihabitans sp. TG2]